MEGAERPRGSRLIERGNYRQAFGVVLIAGILFTLTDFLTSFIALNEGFREGNSMLTVLASYLNLSALQSLLIVKATFIIGITTLALVGARAKDVYTRRMMLGSVTFFMVLFAFVSANNLYWILS